MSEGLTIRGQSFPSYAAVAAAFGIKEKSVRNAVRIGRVDQIGLRPHLTRFRTGPVPMTIRVRGQSYPSVRAVARRLKVAEDTVRTALLRGREDYIGLGVSRKHRRKAKEPPPHNAREVIIGAHHWTSIRLAAAALGVHRDTLARHIDAGDTEWLLAKAMKMTARLEAEAKKKGAR